MPNVAKINARPRGKVCAIIGVLVGVVSGQQGIGASFGGKDLSGISVIREWVGDAPMHIGLFNVGDGLVFERVGFVEEKAFFEISKIVELFACIGQCGSAHFDVAFASSLPCARGRGYDISV